MDRPTKYNEQVLDAALQYVDNFHEDGSAIPSISDLAL